MVRFCISVFLTIVKNNRLGIIIFSNFAFGNQLKVSG